MSISGVQQKLSLKVDSDTSALVPTTSDGEYILKPSPDGLEACAEMEHLCMGISRAMGIETAESGLVEFSDGEKAYITKRYDRTSTGKLHQEDLCSLSDRLKDDKYDSSYEAAGVLLRTVTGNKMAVQNEYFKRVLLSYLVGNDDQHLKNFSVIRQPDNKGLTYDRLTPNYDILCTAFYPTDGIGQLAMPLLESEKEGVFSEAHDYFGYYTKQDFMMLAEKIGLRSVAAEKAIKSFGKKLGLANQLIDRSYVPEHLKEKMKDLLALRYRAICAEKPQSNE
ncbi:type II toxin-antitoxin system HipA family toxin [Amphritea atlantica]|nr:HipA domain-containing protein [Amphritea atlantica]